MPSISRCLPLRLHANPCPHSTSMRLIIKCMYSNSGCWPCTINFFDLASRSLLRWFALLCFAFVSPIHPSVHSFIFTSFIKVIAVGDSDSWPSFYWCLYQSSSRNNFAIAITPFSPAILFFYFSSALLFSLLSTACERCESPPSLSICILSYYSNLNCIYTDYAHF